MGRIQAGAHGVRGRAARTRLPAAAVAAALGCAQNPALAGSDPPVRALPAPDRAHGGPLYAAMAHRRSVRELAGGALTDEELGQLLWAAQGITGDDGLRAAPSAGALYPLTLYVADAGGLWRYLPADHSLVRERAGDRRARLALAGLAQPPLRSAPAVLVITAREAITARKYGARATRYVALEAGHAAHGVLLAVTALGLAAVPIGAFDDGAVKAALSLADDQTPLYLIPLGRPRATPRRAPAAPPPS